MNQIANDKHLEFDWFTANRDYLITHIELLKCWLNTAQAAHEYEKYDKKIAQLQKRIARQKEATYEPFTIDYLKMLFGLSTFESFTLLLAVANEFDSSFLKNSKAEASTTPNFSLALAILPNPEWDALLPTANLRRWGLVTLNPQQGLTSSQLQVPESIVHFLSGSFGEDKEIAKISKSLTDSQFLLSEENNKHVDAICRLSIQSNNTFSSESFFTLIGECNETKRCIALKVNQQLEMNMRVISSVFIPTTLDEMNDFIVIWEREILLNNYLLYIECDDNLGSNIEKEKMVDFFIDRLKWPVIVSSAEKRRFSVNDQFAFEVKKPSVEEQQEHWEKLIGDTPYRDEISTVASHFDLNFKDIQMCCSKVNSTKNSSLWDICRSHTNSSTGNLAEKIVPSQGAQSLILPEREQSILKEIISHVKLRSVVYQDWGLLQNSARGQGISVLFAGASGTGKTTAAEYLALKLRLDLYRIDLSAIVSKYIGETEKNLQKIFAVAEKSGAILLFDEADALFAKRTQVNDSHDRHANVEVSYLLQRIESFRGLAILTSNFKESIDKAFLRRLRFIIQFPFPSKAERELIWRAMLPTNAPTQALDFDKLAQLNVAGGNIRNITMNACFYAAASQESLQMKHYLKSSRDEYLKLEKNLSESEIRSWV